MASINANQNESDKTEMKSTTSYAVTNLTEAELRTVQLYLREHLRKTEHESHPAEHSEPDTHSETRTAVDEPLLSDEADLSQDKDCSGLNAALSACRNETLETVPDNQNDETEYLPFGLVEAYKRKHLAAGMPEHFVLPTSDQSQTKPARACFAVVGLEESVCQAVMTYLNALRKHSVNVHSSLPRTFRVAPA